MSLETASSLVWDVIVIGAGPAGSVAAHQLAKRNLQVLLLDKDIHPRFKVCGSTITPAGLTLLRSLGLINGMDAELCEIKTMEIFSSRGNSAFSLSGGASISRSVLDTHLISEAISAGSSVLFGTRAESLVREEEHVSIALKAGLIHTSVRAKIVVGAGGLAGTGLIQKQPALCKQSYIGVGAEIRASEQISPHKIYMALGKHGYVGATLLANGMADLGGAIDPDFIKDCGGINNAVKSILRESHSEALLQFSDLEWKGTLPLTCSGTVSSYRYFGVGDACGYVEPFTGEGITWAVQSAHLVAPMVAESVLHWHDELQSRWKKLHEETIGHSQRFCLFTRKILRLPPVLRDPLLHMGKSRLGSYMLGKIIDAPPPSWI